MIKVITYGTFDYLHDGHINILRRAKALGDKLYVGVTTENFDITRGKINVTQSLIERIEAVKATGYADEVFPEEYEGQKIDDIRRNDIDIFVVGSDWVGKFDYLREYCQVIYLPRTEGVSSTQIRSNRVIKLGIVGSNLTVFKLAEQVKYINGIFLGGFYFEDNLGNVSSVINKEYSSFSEAIEENEALYIAVRPEEQFEYVKKALTAGKHVISEAPLAMNKKQASELISLAHKKELQLFNSIRAAYSLPFQRLILLIKSGAIGEVKNIDVTCTSLEVSDWLKRTKYYSSFTGWGATALLPIFKILGEEYDDVSFLTLDSEEMPDIYTKATIKIKNALATINVGVGVKSEGDLRISGTKGYVYVPAPWWMSEYFEVRYEDLSKNKPYYYDNEGAGLRSELVQFVRCINNNEKNLYFDDSLGVAICKVMQEFNVYRNKQHKT